MPKRITPAAHWQRRDDPVRRIAARGVPGLKADLKDVLRKLRELVPANAVAYASAGDWWGLLHNMDWNHFRQVMRAPAGRINKIREEAAQLGARQINERFATAGRRVRFHKAYDPNEPRDDQGRWTAGSFFEPGPDAKFSIDAQDVGEFTKDSKIKGMVYASTSPDVADSISRNGFDPSKTSNRTWQGAAIYAFPHAEGPSFGDARMRLAFDVRNPFVGDSTDMERMIDGFALVPPLREFAPGVSLPIWESDQAKLNAITQAWKDRGYDGLIHTDTGVVAAFNPDSVRVVRWGDLRKAAGDQFAFDLYTEDMQQQLRDAQDELIRELEGSVRDSVEQIILNGAQMGMTPDQIVDDIRSLIGLTRRQAQAVENYRNMLNSLDSDALNRQLRNFLEDETVQDAIDGGEDLSQEMIDKLVQDYQDNYLDYRAETIAQTESTRAANYGIQDAYEQAIENGVFPADAVRQHWRIALDEKTCLVCRSIPDRNPNGVPMGEPFDSISGPVDAPSDPHPGCRCSIEVITDLDQVDTTSDEAAA